MASVARFHPHRRTGEACRPPPAIPASPLQIRKRICGRNAVFIGHAAVGERLRLRAGCSSGQQRCGSPLHCAPLRRPRGPRRSRVSMAAIRPSRLVALPASSSERLRSASSVRGIAAGSALSFSAISRSDAPLLLQAVRHRRGKVGLLLARSPCRIAASSARSATSLSVSPRMPGTTAPSRMALRTEASASSGVTRRAGGGLRPMRCSAASTSASSPRRSCSERRTASSLHAEIGEFLLAVQNLLLQRFAARGGIDQCLSNAAVLLSSSERCSSASSPTLSEERLMVFDSSSSSARVSSRFFVQFGSWIGRRRPRPMLVAARQAKGAACSAPALRHGRGYGRQTRQPSRRRQQGRTRAPRPCAGRNRQYFSLVSEAGIAHAHREILFKSARSLS